MSDKNKGKIVILACVIIIAISLLIAFILPLSELFVENDEIAIIEISGPISYDSNSKNISVDSIESGINSAINNPNIKAIVFEINSKGGSLVASEEISKNIKSSKKPTVAWISDRGISEAYLIASSADIIIATPSSAIGGIGLSFLNSTKYSKIGIDGYYNPLLLNTTYKVSKSVNKNSFKSSKLANSQEMMNQDYSYLIKLISQNRKLKANYVSKISNSKVYNGNEALTVKLIDKLGDKQKAIEIAASKAKINNYTVIKYPEDKKSQLTTFLNKKMNS